VCRYLEENEGFSDLVNLEGGIVAWHQAGLPITSGQ
jgi:rhodanese-related sulfurtransferase